MILNEMKIMEIMINDKVYIGISNINLQSPANVIHGGAKETPEGQTELQDEDRQ